MPDQIKRSDRPEHAPRERGATKEAPGARRHIHNALAAGAMVEEIMEVLKLCVAQGVEVLQSRRTDPRVMSMR